VGALWAGPGGGLAAALVCGTALARGRATQRRHATATVLTALGDALGVLVAELRGGAHPGEALAAASAMHASGCSGAAAEVHRALATAAAAARLGGDVPTVLRGTGPAPLRAQLERLAQAWSLASRYGIPLAELLETVREDTELRVRFAAEIHARLAGPRATAAVLAALPLLGVALGHAMGAAPLSVLRGTTMGQVLLIIGSGLTCAGVLWSARLVSRAVPA
jgi:tight adherence protein B